jgi:hypothetical protein
VEPPHSAIDSRDSTGFSFVAICGTLCKPGLLRVLLLRMLFRFLHRILHLRLLCVRQNREKIAARNGPLNRNQSQFQLLHLLGDRSKELGYWSRRTGKICAVQMYICGLCYPVLSVLRLFMAFYTGHSGDCLAHGCRAFPTPSSTLIRRVQY